MHLLAPQIYTPQGFTKESIFSGRHALASGAPKALDVGCGSRKLPGAIGVDIVKTSDADIVHDLSLFPWPIADNEFDLVLMNHSLEHMHDLLGAISEVHRVSKPGGRVVIQVPHFRCLDAYVDPTHWHFFTSRSLDYFVIGSNYTDYNYIPVRFNKLGFWYGWPHHSRNPLRELFKIWAHRRPDFYDAYLSLLLPVECLTWELEVIK